MTEDITKKVKRAEDNASQFLKFREEIQSEHFRPIKTGLDFYDELLDGGATAQTLTILLAEQGSGKTMLMQQLAESIAAKHRQRVIYLNFEMSREQLLARAISARVCRRGNIKKSQKDILRGYAWTDKDRTEILDTIDEYERESLPYISYNPQGIAPTVEAIEDYLKELSEPGAAPILFVDYLQLIQSGSIQDVKDRITQILIDLKSYAVVNNTLVFLISAVNRISKGNINASSARDSSAIEYQADYLLSLQNYKDQAAANEKGLQRMVLKVLKSRDGVSGIYSIVYRDGKNNLFTGEYKGVYQEPKENADPEELPEAYKVLSELYADN